VALAADRDLLEAVRSLPAVADAARAARSGAPDAVQRLYDRARDLEEDLRASAPVSESCRPLHEAALAVARSHVLAAEGVDRLSPGTEAEGRRRARAATRRVEETRGRCRPVAAPRSRQRVPELTTPRPGEAFFGAIRAPAPVGAVSADVLVDGAVAARQPVTGREIRAVSPAAPGRHDIRVIFRGATGGVAGTAGSEDVWTLPAAARTARDGTASSGAIAARLRRLAGGFRGHTGIWVHDLSSGVVAGYNADARFPAASTVKLALLVGALTRLGSAPERSRHAYDLRAMAGWSSNLATNRILARLGGSVLAQGVMTRLGASRSTFTGGYIAGTELQPELPDGGVVSEPPAVSSRVTTARDMGRLLFAVHAAAAGRPDALAATGLTLHQARVGLALLLDSEQRGDNRSLVAGALPPDTPVAQKNGWLRRARHGAAIVYLPAGPRIVVLLTYSDAGVTRERAAALGAAVARITP
jgi:beta-lactamase class A